MKFNKWGRILVCLLLICALVVNISPIKAEATGAGAALGVIKGASLVSVPVAFWVVAALVAIGVVVDQVNDADFTQYNTLVDNATAFLTDAGTYVKDGMVEMIRVVDETGKAVFYAAGDAMEALRGWLCDSGTVEIYSTSVSVYGCTFTSESPMRVVYFQKLSGSSYYRRAAVYSPTAITASITGYPSGTADINGVVYSWRSVNLGSGYEYDSSMVVGYPSDSSMFEYITAHGYSPCSVSDGLALEAFPTVPIDGTGARQWSEEFTDNGLYVVGTGGSGNNNNNDGKWFWKLMLPLTLADLYAMSQAEHWAAETPAEFDQYETKEELTVSPGQEVEFGQSIELAPIADPDTGSDSDTGNDSDSSGDSSELTWWQRFTQWFLELRADINELPNRFDEHFENVNSSIDEVPSKFESWINGVQTSVDAVAENILGTAAEINAAIQGLPDTFLSHVSVITEAIGAVPQAIVVGLRSVLESLFVPDPEFIPNKVEALKAEYKFLDPMLSTGEDLKLFFQNIGSQPPIIWIDLGAGTGWYPMGGKVKFVDLTWYAQYKPIMDPIIGGSIWLWLAWRMFKAIPGMLSGDSGTVGMPTVAPDITFNTARLPAGRSRRKKDGD